ncbi:MAG TPA: hypothetical protein VJA82_05480 [Sediminibacterium sp.]|uniref:hypothetical protein n=1 Tax=Sediminibacterium sp. TaxID=1917865 RepID=UPI0008BEC62D|nr:hypothetical protein [Sediminibacterium sp.]OHC85630.1 MAG: hypothetical protein A2472_07710 [Sphingobacteriia bacterium RIFOXYC2_FULL_35_18]OHC89293.1 MAG: hypothetical protein A2546_07135 [Sphingobacteriia bacterium RIFOXYD2_FULL_35_12]HLD52730.1 hypothetical protein [Sediminibacterium sp.]
MEQFKIIDCKQLIDRMRFNEPIATVVKKPKKQTLNHQKPRVAKSNFLPTRDACDMLKCNPTLLKYYRDNGLIDWCRINGKNMYDIYSIRIMPILRNRQYSNDMGVHFTYFEDHPQKFEVPKTDQASKPYPKREVATHMFHFMRGLAKSISNTQKPAL